MSSDLLPVLAQGKHRNPRRGACFMEFASLLAGERWSDHPRCTHPVLSALARKINDVTTDAARPMLAPLIPDVIGTNTDDLRVAPALAALTCRRTLRHARDPYTRHVLAVALVSAERVLAEVDQTRSDSAGKGDDTTWTPAERSAAEAFVRRFRVSPRFYRRFGAQGVVERAVTSLVDERGPDTDAVLRQLLTDAVALVRTIVPADHGPVTEVGDEKWESARARIGAATKG